MDLHVIHTLIIQFSLSVMFWTLVLSLPLFPMSVFIQKCLYFHTYLACVHLILCIFQTGKSSTDHISHLCGGIMVAVSDPHRQGVVGASSCIKPTGDGYGSWILLDVKVLFLIATWEIERPRRGKKDRIFNVRCWWYSIWGLWIRLCPAVRCNISDNMLDTAALMLTGCKDDASWHRPPASEILYTFSHERSDN